MSMKKSFAILLLWVMLCAAADRTADTRGMEIVPGTEIIYENETEAGTGTQAAAGSGNGTEAQTEADTGTESETREEADPGSGSEQGPGAKSETEQESESGQETGTEAEQGPESGQETGAEIEQESESGQETGTEAEQGPETEQETGSESETGTESESETGTETEEKIVRISSVRIVVPEGEEENTKEYDGTTEIPLEAEITGLPDGMMCRVTGSVPEPDAGEYEVGIRAELSGEGCEEYSVEIGKPAEPLKVTILPRRLHLVISDAKKQYFSDDLIGNLAFEGSAVTVYGFPEDEEGKELIPGEFELPRLTIDETVLKKDSVMFRNGEPVIYEKAVIIMTNDRGEPTGNTTANYRYDLEDEEYYTAGNVILTAPPVAGTLDYRVVSPGGNGFWQDEKGRLWIRKGGSLEIIPEKGRGFDRGKTFSQLVKDGTAEFTLTRSDTEGNVTAVSKPRSIRWYVDDKAPSGTLLVNGHLSSGKEYFTEDVTVSLSQAGDSQSGIRRIRMSVVRNDSPGGAGGSGWIDRTEVTLTEDGSYTVYAKLEDCVGNTETVRSGEVVIDRKDPGITITGAAAGSANKGPVMPVVTVSDANLSPDGTNVSFYGSQDPERKAVCQTELLDGKMIFRFADIPAEKNWDDIYILKVSGADQAGNRSEQTRIFSVNRFGSVYYPEGDLQEKMDSYYHPEAFPVEIREINVDDVIESRITLVYEGRSMVLQKGKDYTVGKEGGGRTWRSYRYMLPASLFRKEGCYYLIFTSRDRADNIVDNRMQQQKIGFAIDRTAPMVILSGIRDGEIVRKEKLILNLECIDNLALEEIEVRLNGRLLIQNRTQDQKITVGSADRWQEIVVTAKDKAGNVSTTGRICFWLGNAAVTERPETAAAGESGRAGINAAQASPVEENGPDGRASYPDGQVSYPYGRTSYTDDQTPYPDGQTADPSGGAPYRAGEEDHPQSAGISGDAYPSSGAGDPGNGHYNNEEISAVDPARGTGMTGVLYAGSILIFLAAAGILIVRKK